VDSNERSGRYSNELTERVSVSDSAGCVRLGTGF
jgi:hypothetical protein